MEVTQCHECRFFRLDRGMSGTCQQSGKQSWEYSQAGSCNPELKRPCVAPKTDDHGRILP